MTMQTIPLTQLVPSAENVRKTGIKDGGQTLTDILNHVSDIRKQYGLSYSPGGWYHKDTEPPVLPAYRPQRVPKTV